MDIFRYESYEILSLLVSHLLLLFLSRLLLIYQNTTSHFYNNIIYLYFSFKQVNNSSNWYILLKIKLQMHVCNIKYFN